MSRRNVLPLWRVGALALLIFASIAGLVTRLAYLQILQHNTYKVEAQEQHFGQTRILAHRGAILDRNGFPLATSVDAFDIYIDPKAWTNRANAEKTAQAVAPLLNRTPQQILSDADTALKGDNLLARGASFDVGKQIARLEL